MELVFLKPKLIVTLGKFAFSRFCPGARYSDSLGSIQKTKINQRTYNIFPIYHPSGMNLSMEVRRKKFEKDIALLCKLINHWGQDGS
jgi:uracil-DNA glycosylase